MKGHTGCTSKVVLRGGPSTLLEERMILVREDPPHPGQDMELDQEEQIGLLQVEKGKKTVGPVVQRHETQVREMKPPDTFREMSVVSRKHRAKCREGKEPPAQAGARWPGAHLLAEKKGKSWKEGL